MIYYQISTQLIYKKRDEKTIFFSTFELKHNNMIDIIGAGIGGLTLALALEKKGLDVRIFEQSPEIKPIGAGIILANNAMQVFKSLGIHLELQKMGNPLFSINITNANLRPISTIDLQYFEQKNKVGTTAIHRGELQKVLLNALKKTTLVLDHKIKAIDQQNENIKLTFENGNEVFSKFAIGADGIHSTVRQAIFPTGQIRTAHQICWRGVTDFELPIVHQNELNEAWNTETRFGYVQIAPNKVYWYALKSNESAQKNITAKLISSYFDSFNPLVKQIIQATPTDSIHTAQIEDLKPMTKWYHSNICLIGDAAHAATPNMGQGACQAIEDAHALALCLSKYEQREACQKFQQLRYKKANTVVNTSWKIGKIAHTSSRTVAVLRNQFFRMIPAKLGRKRSERLFELAEL